MNIIAGIIVSITAAATTTWAVAGSKLATVPAIRRALDYVDGGFNVPSDEEVDRLMQAAEDRKALGLADADELMPDGVLTYGEDLESVKMPACVSEAAIDAASQHKRVSAPLTGWRGWLAGGYNMPTETQVTAAPPHTLRGRHRGHIPAGWIFEDENPEAYAETTRLLTNATALAIALASKK